MKLPWVLWLGAALIGIASGSYGLATYGKNLIALAVWVFVYRIVWKGASNG